MAVSAAYTNKSRHPYMKAGFWGDPINQFWESPGYKRKVYREELPLLNSIVMHKRR